MNSEPRAETFAEAGQRLEKSLRELAEVTGIFPLARWMLAPRLLNAIVRWSVVAVALGYVGASTWMTFA